MTRRVGLLFGGRSVEHEVSVTSARSVARAMQDAGLACVPIAVDGRGRWLSPDLSRAILDGKTERVDPAVHGDDGARVVLDPGGERLLQVDAGGASHPVDVDVVFPLVHGHGGEDGRFQGALETSGIPYVGAGVLGSALAMDKAVTKQVAQANGLRVVPWIGLMAHEHAADPDASRRRVADTLGFPAFVKPANGGSSVGVSRVDAPETLDAALAEAFACDAKVIVERALDAREIECAVLGDLEAEASVPGEIVPSGRFYDYAAKYVDNASELIIPASIEARIAAGIRRDALRAFRCLELSGFARVDFLVDRGDDEAYLNEVNTLPGFTPISMFPKLWAASGVAYPTLIVRLVELAVQRRDRERRLRSQHQGS